MSDFTHIIPHVTPGKHNMASDAFQALRVARAEGKPSDNMKGFGDLLDTINPLQHIPIVSSIYRELTGDKISPQARMAGGAIYGGPIGFVASIVESAIAGLTGDDIGGHLMAGLFGDDDEATAQNQTKPEEKVAANIPPAPTIEATGSLATTPLRKARTAPSSPATTPAHEAAPHTLATASVPPSLPQLSPEAFNALLNSFTDPKAAKTANSDLAARVAANAPSPDSAAAKPGTPALSANLMSSMASGLDQLDALKAANAKAVSLNAAGSTVMSGF